MKRAFTIIAAAIVFTSCTSNAQRDPYDVILAKEQAYVDSLSDVNTKHNGMWRPTETESSKIEATWKAYDNAFKKTKDSSSLQPSVSQLENHIRFLKATDRYVKNTDYLKK